VLQGMSKKNSDFIGKYLVRNVYLINLHSNVFSLLSVKRSESVYEAQIPAPSICLFFSFGLEF
jgi:hypothetical protein